MELFTDRQLEFRFLAHRGTMAIDLTSYLTGTASITLGDVSGLGTGNTGADGVVRTATFELINERPAVDFHPLNRRSAQNLVNGVYSPLLTDYRRVTFEVRDRAAGTPWALLFDGYLGDDIASSGMRITLQARDLAKRLQDEFIDEWPVFGSEEGTPAEVVLQDLLNHAFGSSAPALVVPVPTLFMVTEFQPDPGTVWDAMQALVLQFGWWLGYWDWPDGFHLTLLEPPRNANPSQPTYTLTGQEVITQHLSMSANDVRNAVTVHYRDAATNERRSVYREDPDSIQNITAGVRKHMVLEEADTSQINTALEAERLALVALHDLADLIGNTRITMPYQPIRVFDTLQVRNQLLSSEIEYYAVQSVRHTFRFDPGEFRTEVIGVGKVVGARRRWLDLESRPGSPNAPIKPMAAISAINRAPTTAPSVRSAPGSEGVGAEVLESEPATIPPNTTHNFFFSIMLETDYTVPVGKELVGLISSGASVFKAGSQLPVALQSFTATLSGFRGAHILDGVLPAGTYDHLRIVARISAHNFGSADVTDVAGRLSLSYALFLVDA